ncbi:hypothetical protein [uncultured Dokdonia sp.]|uniref:hypothetical protein n=1 Tax=uncultured Dokdonia sp. TaxID=575653 RepID=UPI00262803C8|nr:hypothetical protein [uncultured Dokdonia sp.]
MKKKKLKNLNFKKEVISKLSSSSIIGGLGVASQHNGHTECPNTVIFDECLTSFDYECPWSNQTVDPNDSPRIL